MGARHRKSRDGLADELERQKQYFESLLEISPVAIVTTDLETKVTSWNPEAERLFGYTRDEAVGRTIDDLIANSDELREEAAAFVAETSGVGRFHAVTRRMRKDGTLVDVDLLAVTVALDGEPAGYYVLYHDISELQRQKQYYASLFELSPTAVVTIDPDANVTSWNAAAERLFGYTTAEASGRNIDDLVAHDDRLRADAAQLTQRGLTGEQSQFVRQRTRKDGTLVDVEVRAAAIVVGGEQVGTYVIYHDISELQRQKRYYESLFELSPTAIATIDRADNVTSWNAAAERLFGYSHEEAIGRNIDDLVASTNDLRAEGVELARLAEHGEVHRVTRRMRKDGSLVDVDARAAPVMVGGENVGMFCLYHDISELQRQQRYYESLVELSPTAIVTVDVDRSNVTSWNPAAERLFGYTAAEALGQNIDDLVAQDERLHAEAAAVSSRGRVGESSQLVTQRTRKDGTLLDVQVLAAPIVVAGEQVGFYALYHDISELQRQKRYYESLLEVSPTAVVTFDTEANVTAWNPAAEQLFGYTAAEAIGHNVDDLVAKEERLHAEAVAENERVKTGQVQLVTQRTRKDGSLVDVQLLGAPVVVAGEQVGFYALYHDISDLQRARREAEAATEAKSAFLATMSHEIRTPMNAVIGMTDLLLRTELDAEQQSFAEVIRTSGEALLSVINDILDFSKIEAGRLDLDRQPFDLRECVESALELVARGAADKGLDLAYLLRPETPEALVGDAARLRQILLNLLNNAVKFTERGEVVLTVDAEPLAAVESTDREAGRRYRLHFAVSDTGIGIPEERIDSLFESFSQVDASTTRRYGGTGLGLAISKRLTELMGGTMCVESRAGEGSTFQFTMEAESAPRPERAYEQAETVPLAGRRVLILDDNATNRHILQSQTDSWGMLARNTGSAAEALEWVRRGDPFDVAILDMQMPDMDGVAVAREIRSTRGDDRLPLILLTSLGRREEEADEALFTARLTKPIRPSQLYDVLLDVLGAPAPRAASREAAPRVTIGKPTPLRILVVEDNPVNRQLVLLLLEKLGYRADIAVNGVEALEALERDAYDVVLMDVQMPEMDGLEATRQIHERLASRRPHIIAATANAMQDERERCLEAGMDDYLSKPIRMEALATALGRVRGRSDSPAGDVTACESPGRSEVLDASVLDGLRATLGEAVTQELVDTFLVEAPKLMSTLGLALDRSDADELRRAAHTLKSNAATFGATALSELGRELEAMGKAKSLHGVRQLLPRVESEYEQVRSALEIAGGSGMP